MDLSMKEKNDKAAWDAYQAEGQMLIAETSKRAKIIDEKYDDPLRTHGLDGNPGSREHKELMHWFGQEVKHLREKYGITD